MAGLFIRELKRRNVFRVAIVYIVVSWLLMQIGDVMFPALRLPDWTPTLLAAFLILGFPLVVVFAWAFELTPDGMVRTEDVPREKSITADTGRKINYIIIAVLALAVVFLLVKDALLPNESSVADTFVADQSIAVLPFKNQSASAENAQFFSDGLHDELLTLLSRLGDLRVISRTSVERLDPNLSIVEIGTLFDVATVLEGQVQRAGDRLRINIQLIDVSTEGHIWANTYDSELTAENVFDVQSDIARTIADALHAELSPDDELALAALPTTNTAALEKYLLGVHLASRQSFGALDDAIGYLTEATVLDPTYAEAWTALAATYALALQTGAISTKEYIRSAEPAVRNALTANPRFGPAHTQQGILQFALGNPEAAEESFNQALDLDPNNSMTVSVYAFFLRNSFRSEEAIPLLEQALVNDPLSTELLFQLGKAEMHAGRPERFVDLAERIREIDPSVIHGYTGVIQAYLWMGKIDEALPWYLQNLEFDPLDYETWAHLAVFLAELGLPDLAERYQQRAEELGPEEPAVLMCRILLLLTRGEIDAARRVASDALAADLDNRWGSDVVILRTVRDAALDSGHVADVLELYRERVPRLFEDEPVVTYATSHYAVDVVLPLRHAGHEEQADRVIAATLELYDRINPNRVRGYDTGIMDVNLLALAGETDLAIERLQEAVDGGWLFNAHYLATGRNLDAIKSRPEYADIMAQIQAREDQQRANWLATPHAGEFDLRDPPAK